MTELGTPITGQPPPIILDCDPGHDDALAILLAIAGPELELLAVTTVAGNVPLAASHPSRWSPRDPATM